MRVEADGFAFDFPDALHAFRFDEQDKTQPHFHGLSHAMKAVDLVVELPENYLFIEIKDFHAPDDYDFKRTMDTAQKDDRRTRVNHLNNVLNTSFETPGCTDGPKEKLTNR